MVMDRRAALVLLHQQNLYTWIRIMTAATSARWALTIMRSRILIVTRYLLEQDKLMRDIMTSPAQLIFLQSCPPHMFQRFQSEETLEADAGRPLVDFIMNGDSEFGLAVLGRKGYFSRFSDGGLQVLGKWAVYYVTIHFVVPLCNIVALPVATVVALPEARWSTEPADTVIEFLTKRNVRLFGMQFSQNDDIPDLSSVAQVLAWQPYLADGASEMVAPAVLCAVGNISSVRRLFELDDKTTWQVRTERESPTDKPLAQCPTLTNGLKPMCPWLSAPSSGTLMQVLPASNQKPLKAWFPEVTKLMVFLGSNSRRGATRFSKKQAVKGKGKAKQSSGQSGDSQPSARGNEPVS